jgi:hypothetical protein
VANPSSLWVGWAVACLCAAPACADTIYQCTGKDGKQVLQNMPCEADSGVRLPDMGDAKSAASAAGAAQGASVAAPAADRPSGAAAGTARDSRDTRANASAGETDAPLADSDRSANAPTERAEGMTQQQVRAILGEPTAVTQEEVVDGRQTTWNYGDRVLQFDTSGRLIKK